MSRYLNNDDLIRECIYASPLRWRHNGRDSVSNHQPHDCLLNRSFRRRSKKTSKLRVTGLCAGIHRGPVNSPHKWPVTRKMFPFDDVIMTRRPFYYHGIILILTWIGYHMPSKVWDEITYPFQNYNGATVKVWEWKCHFIPHFIMDVIIYPCQD